MSGGYNGHVSHYGCKCSINLDKGNRGLGPNGWGSIRHLLPYHITFHKAAYFHDLAYSLALISRKQIDRKFYEMIDKEKDTIWSFVYYILVRVFGWAYYNKNNEK